MRSVLVLTADFPPDRGGIQLLVHRVVRGMRTHRPTVVTHAAPGAALFDASEPYDIVRPSARPRGNRGRVALLNATSFAVGLRRRPDVVLSAHIVVGPAAVALGSLLRVPVVQYLHAQEINRRPELARRILARSDAVIAVSTHTRGLALSLGADDSRVHVVHPGVDCVATSIEVKGSNSVVTVARLEERYKGHDTLLRALALVRARVPDVHLEFVGDGRLRPHLESLARSFGVAEAVTFHGRLSDQQRDAILDRAAVFAMPSRIDAQGAGEGFGIVFIEAGAHRLPVVAGAVAGALDAVEDGKTGLLVDPTDHLQLAEALETLLSDDALRVKLGSAGLDLAQSMSWEGAAEQVEEILNNVARR